VRGKVRDLRGIPRSPRVAKWTGAHDQDPAPGFCAHSGSFRGINWGRRTGVFRESARVEGRLDATLDCVLLM
jgi:hypothetical protein